jgi:hypothetical protein
VWKNLVNQNAQWNGEIYLEFFILAHQVSSVSTVLAKFHRTKLHAKNYDFAHVILLFLDAQSTDQDNNCQVMFGREAEKVVILILHEVQFFVILPMREKGKIQFLIIHFLRSKHWILSIYFKISHFY